MMEWQEVTIYHLGGSTTYYRRPGTLEYLSKAERDAVERGDQQYLTYVREWYLKNKTK
jgi:acetyl-CoA carboxylase carboxyltransferase component